MAAEAPPSLGAICALLCSANSKRENEIAEYFMSGDNEIYLNSVCSRLANVPLLLDSYSGGLRGGNYIATKSLEKVFLATPTTRRPSLYRETFLPFVLASANEGEAGGGGEKHFFPSFLDNGEQHKMPNTQMMM